MAILGSKKGFLDSNFHFSAFLLHLRLISVCCKSRLMINNCIRLPLIWFQKFLFIFLLLVVKVCYLYLCVTFIMFFDIHSILKNSSIEGFSVTVINNSSLNQYNIFISYLQNWVIIKTSCIRIKIKNPNSNTLTFCGSTTHSFFLQYMKKKKRKTEEKNNKCYDSFYDLIKK